VAHQRLADKKKLKDLTLKRWWWDNAIVDNIDNIQMQAVFSE